MDHVDKALLNMIQISFPVDPHPYRVLGERTGISETEAWERIGNLRDRKIIRRIGGIFDSRRLGYVSTLCAAKVPEDRIGPLGELCQGITEITHNYLRNHLYNMWFTVIASSPERLEWVLSQVRRLLGSNEVYSLPAQKIFKIGVIFELQERAMPFPKERISSPSKNSFGLTDLPTWDPYRINQESPLVVTEEDKALIRLLQTNLPGSLTPFAELAEVLKKDEKAVLSRILRLKESKAMRRIGAILYHYQAGFTSNAMGVWVVPEDRVQEAGNIMARFREVSHCYQRPVFPDWPYNLFTMIHGESDGECREIMERLSRAAGVKDYDLLFSQKELKKSSMRYFSESESRSIG